MSKLEINVFDLSEWRAEHKIMYTQATINGHNLKLLANLFGGFEIMYDGVIINQQIQPFAITEKYNELIAELEKEV